MATDVRTGGVKLPAGYDRELGSPGQASWSGILETYETAAELTFPNSVVVYDRMRRVDAQIRSVLRAITLPIRRTRWFVSGDDCDPRVKAAVELELGLTPDGRGRARRRGHGISWPEFLRHALLMLPLGFMPFEQVYEVGPPSPELDATGLPPNMAHIRKLAPRMPRSVTKINVATDGGLDSIGQYVPRPNPKGMPKWQEVTIPVERLVMFCYEREGADWLGNSILRSSYPNFIIKDVLLRLGPQAVERNGMGLPVIHYPEGGDANKALAIAKSARAGEEAGIAIPDDFTFELVGVSGSVADSLPLLNFHNQEMARQALAMFLDLGHDRGARSLGETFVNFFVMSLNAVCEEFAEVVTEHVIRDYVELNFGAEEPYPELAYDDVEPGAEVTMQGLAALVQVGAIDADDPLKDALRRRLSLPPASAAVPEEPGAPGTPELPGPQSVTAINVDPTGTPVMTAASASVTYEAETEAINTRRLTPEAAQPHAFKAAEWTHPNGHPRCALCGAEESVTGRCDGSNALRRRTHASGLTLEQLEARLAEVRTRYAHLG